MDKNSFHDTICFMKLLSLCALALTCLPFAGSEEFKLLGLPFNWRSSFDVDLIYESTTKADAESGGEYAYHRMRVQTTTTLIADDKKTLLVELDGELIDQDRTGSELQIRSNDLKAGKLGIAGRYIDESGKRWVGALAYITRTDDVLEDEKARAARAFFAVYVPDGDRNAWTLGLNYTTHMDYPLPLIAYNWNFSNDLRFALGLPYVFLHWQANEKWLVQFRNFATSPGLTVSYFLKKRWSLYAHSARSGWNAYLADRIDEDERYRYGSWRAGLGMRYRLYPGTEAAIEFGSEFERQLEVQEGANFWDDTRDDEDLDSAFYLQIRTQVAF